jgi:hypothetical protein
VAIKSTKLMPIRSDPADVASLHIMQDQFETIRENPGSKLPTEIKISAKVAQEGRPLWIISFYAAVVRFTPKNCRG